jgi:uncharacterized protein YbjT (DUF2867 family)
LTAERPLRILLFGASGSAGGSVLRACLADPGVAAVHAITRRPLSHTSDNAGKLRVLTHHDYLDYSAVGQAFVAIDACFFCLGRSVSQVSGEAEYRRITHDFTLAAARMLHEQSPGAVFHYISGQGTNLRLIRSGGHVPKGGYDVPHGERRARPASPATVL